MSVKLVKNKMWALGPVVQAGHIIDEVTYHDSKKLAKQYMRQLFHDYPSLAGMAVGPALHKVWVYSAEVKKVKPSC